MAQQKKGWVARLLEGKEKSEEYARSTLPTNRWQLFWDIFKGNFWKLVKANLLTIIFFVPLFIVIILYTLMMDSNGIIYPFGANLGVGYPAAPMQQGVAELLVLQNGFLLYLGLIFTSIIAAVGLAGGMYVMRNMVWTEGIFVSNDFWRGIKLNYKNALQTALFFCIVLLFTTTLLNFSELTLSIGNLSTGQLIWIRVSQVMSYFILVLSVFISFWMIALGVNYQTGFLHLVKNALLMSVGTFPQTILFSALASLPFLLLIFSGGFIQVMAVVIVILFGISWALLLWLDFAQWVFDRYINPKLKGAKVGRGIYNKDGSSSLTGDDSAASLEYKRALLAHGKSRLVARPIKPLDDDIQVYELPKTFSREDLQKLRESKQNLLEDSEAYAEEHKNDLRYVEYNRQFEEREKALQDEVDANGKKKKRKPPKMLGD